MAVGLVFQETIVWLGALYIVKKPLPIDCLPIRDIEYRRCDTPFFDLTGLGVPLRASLYTPDLVTAESFFPLRTIRSFERGPPGPVHFYEEIRCGND